MRKLISVLTATALLMLATACGASTQTATTTNIGSTTPSVSPSTTPQSLVDQLLNTKWGMDGSQSFIEFTSTPYTSADRSDTALGKVYTLKTASPSTSYNNTGYIITDKCPITATQVDSFGTTPITSWNDCGEGATAYGTAILDAGKGKTGWGDAYYVQISLSPDGQTLTFIPRPYVRSADGSNWDEEDETPQIALRDPVWADAMSVNGNDLVLQRQN